MMSSVYPLCLRKQNVHRGFSDRENTRRKQNFTNGKAAELVPIWANKGACYNTGIFKCMTLVQFGDCIDVLFSITLKGRGEEEWREVVILGRFGKKQYIPSSACRHEGPKDGFN